MPAAPILVAGEALYDLVAHADGSVSGHPGGGPFNTARTIARLRQPVAYLGRLSTDRLGETLSQRLLQDGVDLSATTRTDEPSTLALASLDGEGVASYSFYAAGTAAPGLTPAAALAALPLELSPRCTSARWASCSSPWPRPWRRSSAAWRVARWSSWTPTAARGRSTRPTSTARGWSTSSRCPTS